MSKYFIPENYWVEFTVPANATKQDVIDALSATDPITWYYHIADVAVGENGARYILFSSAVSYGGYSDLVAIPEDGRMAYSWNGALTFVAASQHDSRPRVSVA